MSAGIKSALGLKGELKFDTVPEEEVQKYKDKKTNKVLLYIPVFLFLTILFAIAAAVCGYLGQINPENSINFGVNESGIAE